MNKKKSKAQKKKKALKKKLKMLQAEARATLEKEIKKDLVSNEKTKAISTVKTKSSNNEKLKAYSNEKTKAIKVIPKKKQYKKKNTSKSFYDQELEITQGITKQLKKSNINTDTIILPKIDNSAKTPAPVKTNKSRTVAKKEDVFSKIGEWFANIGASLKRRKVTNVKKKPKVIKEEEIEEEKPKRIPKNPILRTLYKIHENLYILFDTALIITFIILILGMKRVLVIPPSTIKYIACIVGFLGIVALSLNRYISGRILSIFLLAGMIGGIYYLNYTYDFINNFNEKLYEYKEYYVVAIDNGRNKSIYNINNKRVGLLKENSKNVERVLNTKLENVKYKTYTDQEKLYIDFINNEYRAIVVNENQYKYIKNNNINPDIKIKILYKFKVNCKKET